jgi:hypothetical protein
MEDLYVWYHLEMIHIYTYIINIHTKIILVHNTPNIHIYLIPLIPTVISHSTKFDNDQAHSAINAIKCSEQGKEDENVKNINYTMLFLR